MIVIWIAAIVVFGIVEAVTVGLVSIWFVLGAVAGLLAAVLGAALWVQIVLFFVVSIAALAATRPLVQKMLHRDETPTNADRVLGQTARVTETIDNTVPTGAVYADGKTWTARSASGRVIPKDTLVKVQRMEGVRLFVEEEAAQPVTSVVFKNLRSVFCQHQSKEDNSLERTSFCCHCVYRCLINIFLTEFFYFFCIERARRKCSHSACIKPCISISCTFRSEERRVG